MSLTVRTGVLTTGPRSETPIDRMARSVNSRGQVEVPEGLRLQEGRELGDPRAVHREHEDVVRGEGARLLAPQVEGKGELAARPGGDHAPAQARRQRRAAQEARDRVAPLVPGRHRR